MTIDQITKAASDLGIKLTHANEGTEIYQCWADRVLEAEATVRHPLPLNVGQQRALRAAAVREANRYAI